MESKESSSMNIVQQKSLNGIQYEMLPSTSVAVNRTAERQFFQKNIYGPSQEALIDMNTGAKFLNCKRSYLTFSCQLSRTADDGGGNAFRPAAGFGKGSVCNLIRRVVVTTRSGVELCRTEDFNLLSAKTNRWECSREYLEQFGELLGYQSNLTTANTDAFPVGTLGPTSFSEARQFVIPLEMLSPVFKGDGKSLLPPQAAAGLRIQITWESTARGLYHVPVATTGTPDTYIIDNISIMANSTTMVDSWQKALNEESASQGLTYTYPTWYTTTSTQPIAVDRINIEQRKAVARALMAFAVYTVGPDSITKDNMKSENYGWSRVEWRLGSLYPTQQPIVNSAEAYFIAQNAFDGGILDTKGGINAVSFNTFKGSESIAAVSLERSDISINGVLNISGLPTNNSRVLSVDATLAVAPSVQGRMYVFMKHISMAKFFLDNTSLSY